VVNVGTVSDKSAATMATAAIKVYQATSTATGLVPGGQESVIFFVQGPSGDTVLYHWFADNSHAVTAATITAGVDLVGVTPAQMIADGTIKF
jgi:hypothetical protein